MACRVGITTDLKRRKAEHERTYRNVRSWREHGPFDNRRAAQDWEDKNKGSCDAHGGGSDPDSSTAKWYGYYFEHDGNK